MMCPLLRGGLLASVCLIVASCGRVDRFIKQMDELIGQLQATRRAIQLESHSWRVHVEALQGQLTDDVRGIIADDLTTFAETVIEDLGIEVRCEFDFVEGKLLGYLDGILDALIAKREEVKRTGRFDGTLEEILRQIVMSQGRVGPWLCHNEDAILVQKVGTRVRIADGFNEEIRLVGFALKRNDMSEYRLVKVGSSAVESPIGDGKKFLSAATDYKMLLLYEQLELEESDRRVRIYWKTEAIGEVILKFVEAPPVADRVKRVDVIFNTTRDDKDARIALKVELVLNTGDGRQTVADARLGRNEVWREGMTKSLTLEPVLRHGNVHDHTGLPFDPDHLYVVAVSMEQLRRSGAVVTEARIGTIRGQQLLAIGGEQVGNKIVLTRSPRTILGDWEGTVQLLLHLRTGTRTLPQIAFRFNDGLVNGPSGPKRVFEATWEAGGNAVE